MENNERDVVAAIGKAFDRAIRLATSDETYDSEECCSAQETAFDLARQLGWDWEADATWNPVRDRMTILELVIAGKARALEVCCAAIAKATGQEADR